MDDVTDTFKAGVTAGEGVYGVPVGNAMGGGVLYNKKVYEELGLEVPTTWAEFMANSQAIKAAGDRPDHPDLRRRHTGPPSCSSSATSTTSRRRTRTGPTSTPRTRRTSPTSRRRSRASSTSRKVFEAGCSTRTSARRPTPTALEKLATGEGAHYPMLTLRAHGDQGELPRQPQRRRLLRDPGRRRRNAPDDVDAGRRLHRPRRPRTSTSAKKFLAFVASAEGCDAQTEAVGVTGPYLVEGCTLPDDVPARGQGHAGRTSTADKTVPGARVPLAGQGPVRSSRSPSRSAPASAPPSDGAALYDEDVKKQAQQLGLEGW